MAQKIGITPATFKKTMAYLMNQPYIEVKGLIEALENEAQVINVSEQAPTEKPEEPAAEAEKIPPAGCRRIERIGGQANA